MEYEVGILLQTINEKLDALTKFLVGKLEEAEAKVDEQEDGKKPRK